MQKYSFKKGLKKAFVSFALPVVGVAVLFFGVAGLSDLTLWGLLETYVKPVLGTATLGGVLIFIRNWLKNKSKEV